MKLNRRDFLKVALLSAAAAIVKPIPTLGPPAHEYFTGQIAEVRVYSSVLSVDFNSPWQLNREHPQAAGLVGWWPTPESEARE